MLVRYFAASEDAAGRPEERLEVATVGDLRSALTTRYGASMSHILDVGSLVVDGVVTSDPARRIRTQVDVLPPFSGG